MTTLGTARPEKFAWARGSKGSMILSASASRDFFDDLFEIFGPSGSMPRIMWISYSGWSKLPLKLRNNLETCRRRATRVQVHWLPVIRRKALEKRLLGWLKP